MEERNTLVQAAIYMWMGSPFPVETRMSLCVPQLQGTPSKLIVLVVKDLSTVGFQKTFPISFRSISFSFRSVLKRRSFTVGIRSVPLPVPFRIVAVHAFARCEGLTVKVFLLAPAWVLPSCCFTFALRKKPCFAPPLASLYRVCRGRVTQNSLLNGN